LVISSRPCSSSQVLPLPSGNWKHCSTIPAAQTSPRPTPEVVHHPAQKQRRRQNRPHRTRRSRQRPNRLISQGPPRSRWRKSKHSHKGLILGTMVAPAPPWLQSNGGRNELPRVTIIAGIISLMKVLSPIPVARADRITAVGRADSTFGCCCARGRAHSGVPNTH
jgi:hypothetical protein